MNTENINHKLRYHITNNIDIKNLRLIFINLYSFCKTAKNALQIFIFVYISYKESINECINSFNANGLVCTLFLVHQT